jgi:hypothetical protein
MIIPNNIQINKISFLPILCEPLICFCDGFFGFQLTKAIPNKTIIKAKTQIKIP